MGFCECGDEILGCIEGEIFLGTVTSMVKSPNMGYRSIFGHSADTANNHPKTFGVI
jgi:hypothetical protein